MKHRPVIRSARALAAYLLTSGEPEQEMADCTGGFTQIPGSILSVKTGDLGCLMMGFMFARLTCA